jgi:hypothetical protein
VTAAACALAVADLSHALGLGPPRLSPSARRVTVIRRIQFDALGHG